MRDTRLVEEALADPLAYRELVELYQGRVFATALRLLGDPSEAQDASQEAFLRAYRSLERFESGRRFGPWVCAICANVARDHLRSPVRRLQRLGLWPQTGSDEAAARPSDPIEASDRQDLLASALMKLKPKIREALVLRFVSDLSVEEVAQALDIGTSAAKMRLKRGLDQLRDELGERAPG